MSEVIRLHNETEKTASKTLSDKRVVNRLARAIGHLEAVKRMVERGEDYSEVLIQMSAVKSAINNTGKLILKNQMSMCVSGQKQTDKGSELLELIDTIEKYM